MKNASYYDRQFFFFLGLAAGCILSALLILFHGLFSQGG